MNNLILSEASKEVEEWLGELTYDYLIGEVQLNANGGYRFYVDEFGPDYQNTLNSYFLTVEPNGKLINDNGEEVIETFIAANLASDSKQWGDYATLDWLESFKAKWYQKGD